MGPPLCFFSACPWPDRRRSEWSVCGCWTPRGLALRTVKTFLEMARQNLNVGFLLHGAVIARHDVNLHSPLRHFVPRQTAIFIRPRRRITAYKKREFARIWLGMIFSRRGHTDFRGLLYVAL